MVEKYIRFFNTALKNKPFERIYIDAFAGSGAFRYGEDNQSSSLFDRREDAAPIHAGSARRALTVSPPFHQVLFIEKDAGNVAALNDLIGQSGHQSAKVLQGNANEILRGFCEKQDWRNRRGVIFLDPFGMNVEWSTLELVASTRALDVWFLFALAGTVRNLPRLASRLDAGKRAAVTRVLGAEDWFESFYGSAGSAHRDLFGVQSQTIRRRATVDDIESYVRSRLQSIFAHVEPPKRLRGPGNKSLFSLFFAVSNPAGVTLALRGAQHILRAG